jgi:hypothetical protein
LPRRPACMSMAHIYPEEILGRAVHVGAAAGRAALRPAASAAYALAEQAIDRTLVSRLARHAVSRALEGPLVDVVAGDLVRYAVVERLVDRLLAEGTVEHAVDRLLDGPELDRVAAHLRTRLLASEDLWLIVDEVARSAAVTEAIAHQGQGFADEVAGRVRTRSRSADAWLERTARRALRRPQP